MGRDLVRKRLYYKEWMQRNPDYHKDQRSLGKHMLYGARRRSKKKNLECNISIEDIIIPDVCPVLGIPLKFSLLREDNIPSLDRIDPSKGYTKENIRVISWRANKLKNDMTVEECRLLLRDLEQP